MNKIAVIGTHGAGKTTFAYMLGAYFKQMGKNVEVISEIIRNSPFAYNDKTTQETVLWAYHAQVIAELNAVAKKFDTIICDRSSFDCIAYAEYRGITNDYIDRVKKGAIEWLKTYDKIFFVIPNIEIGVDDIRSSDIGYQIGVNEIFEQYVPAFERGMGLNITKLYSSQIFDQNFKLKDIL